MIKKYLVSGLFAISLSMNIHANEETLSTQTTKTRTNRSNGRGTYKII